MTSDHWSLRLESFTPVCCAADEAWKPNPLWWFQYGRINKWYMLKAQSQKKNMIKHDNTMFWCFCGCFFSFVSPVSPICTWDDVVAGCTLGFGVWDVWVRASNPRGFSASYFHWAMLHIVLMNFWCARRCAECPNEIPLTASSANRPLELWSFGVGAGNRWKTWAQKENTV